VTGWRNLFSDPEALSDLFAAAAACMAEEDSCDPEYCAHQSQLQTPHEFAQWVQRQVATDQSGKSVRLDHRENRQAGQHQRWHLEAVARSA
jgi:hypothetical protein